MTWSLIARDPATGQFGIAVATKNFAVGAACRFIATGVGAVATQALVNPFYGVAASSCCATACRRDEIVCIAHRSRRRAASNGRSM